MGGARFSWGQHLNLTLKLIRMYNIFLYEKYLCKIMRSEEGEINFFLMMRMMTWKYNDLCHIWFSYIRFCSAFSWNQLVPFRLLVITVECRFYDYMFLQVANTPLNYTRYLSANLYRRLLFSLFSITGLFNWKWIKLTSSRRSFNKERLEYRMWKKKILFTIFFY